ncbi:MAG TPA: phosphate/phosphite/phosphonate ABC transporter substrate-binding protein [Candidatus Competibacteraceae bacterium]|nr:phosphate/phosphite/phosphonate ABC transporter substrate-binding protein [Candidatus Competibacteraceae bacterium]HQA27160.1 phosphate/phosphite/phosphonate ABC transporter substrate-binding protein [Candidatus Competibacteraceae bacterium]HQD55015.1 phosphate/phosphite/phosphonate ABC transporter substrate-binding protein [Candidatus Competibacteraceae bacterium]
MKKSLMILAVMALISSAALAAKANYRFSPINQWDITQTASYWNPIIRYVEERSGIHLELKLGRTLTETIGYVLAGNAEFVFSNHFFAPERDALGWKVFGRRNLPALYGQIAVPEDSSIHKLEELHGKTVLFSGPETFIGYKVTYAELLSRGIRVKTDFSGSQNAAFAQMFSGKADAVGSVSLLLENYAKREHRKFRILWTSESYPDLALMASGKVPAEDLRAVALALLGMHQDPTGREILRQASEAAGLNADTHFIPATAADYAPYYRFYQTAPAALR